MDIITEIFADAAIDALKMLPFLYIAFLIMEFIEHNAGDKISGILEKAGRSLFAGSAAGSVLGCIPQCGFSIAASNLFSSRVIGAGTLMSVFIATSDEAVPIMLSHKEIIGSLWTLILCKIIIAVASGILFQYLYDAVIRDSGVDFDEICSECGCGSRSIWVSALRHTAEIFFFILIVNIIMNAVLAAVGEDNVTAFINNMGFFRPFAAAAVGLIPNCASSVILTELFANGSISFGTALGGLCTNAGMGIAVLFRTNKNIKANFLFLGYLYFVGVIIGAIIDLIH